VTRPTFSIRRARAAEAATISQLIAQFAAEALMLARTPATIEASIDDYVVAIDGARIIACGALKEYSPSLAEVAAIAVWPDAQGKGVGRAIVAAVEALAAKRGTSEVFALTLRPGFFAAAGYLCVDRARYPEKIRRDCLACVRRFACDETCFAKMLSATGTLDLTRRMPPAHASSASQRRAHGRGVQRSLDDRRSHCAE
jgi:N-acetylglutamate synthase-like GNAT family acetyltransferase